MKFLILWVSAVLLFAGCTGNDNGLFGQTFTQPSDKATLLVTYDNNGATGGQSPLDENSPYEPYFIVTVKANSGGLTKTGYTFSSWNTKADGTGSSYLPGSTFPITESAILYAQWITATHTLSYDGNANTGGTAPSDSSSPYSHNSTVTVKTNSGSLVRTGYTFSGWNTQANGAGTSYAAGASFQITADTTLFAKWTINTFTVTYDGNGNSGGNAPSDSSSPYNYNSTVTALSNSGTLVKTGFTFSGWNTQANGTGTSYAPGSTFSVVANTTLYAKWNVATYSLTYYGNGSTGGTAPSDSSSPYNHNATVTVKSNSGTLVKTGYTFVGWNTQSNGSGTDYAAGATFQITAVTNLYAKWEDQTAPTPGTAISFSDVSTTSLKVNWGAASDAVTSAGSLEYKVVRSSATSSIDTIAEANVSSSGGGVSLIADWTTAILAADATSLGTYQSQAYAVLARDVAGNVSLYTPATQSTTCGCSDGEYASSGTCQAAENGYWGASCVRNTCSNKPSNSTYLGSGAKSAQCSWTCDNNYAPNSTYTACVSNAGNVTLSCGSNQVVVGFKGRSGFLIDKLGVICRDFSAGTLVGPSVAGTEFGGSGGNGFTKECPVGSAVYTVDTANSDLNGPNVAGSMRFRCKDVVTGTLSAWLPNTDGDSGSHAKCTRPNGYFYGVCNNFAVAPMDCSTPYFLNWLAIGSSGSYAGPFSGDFGCQSVGP
ncbi:MAG: hypothetical protein EOP06_02980 [Proteobacteria bacterium]|nr:MAG: hypothetical protein EOP06_02980 [Pseudomonadota bacterium]